ncbi:hypothetical protein PFISCL1PPCAC_20135, partial [Pristionchus fissidentatus]
DQQVKMDNHIANHQQFESTNGSSYAQRGGETRFGGCCDSQGFNQFTPTESQPSGVSNNEWNQVSIDSHRGF